MSTDLFSLEAFEIAAHQRDRETAGLLLLRLLAKLNEGMVARLADFVQARVPATLPAKEQEIHLVTRLATVIGVLFADPEFLLSDSGYARLISMQRVLALIFAASPYRNADHVIHLCSRQPTTQGNTLVLDTQAMSKLVMLYSPESEFPLDLDGLWAAAPVLTTCLAFVLLSPRFMASKPAHSKRELLLRWLPDRLDQLEDLEQLPIGVIHDVYMHCSYADLAERHAIKKPLNRLIRRKLEQQGFRDRADLTPRDHAGKPVMVVLLEWFNSSHSIFRTHSRSLEGARRNFYLVGVGSATSVDDISRPTFDEFHPIDVQQPFGDLATVCALVERFAPQVLYMPSVGMWPITLFVSNLRLAPLQVTSWGHPATTHSPYMDCYVVEEDLAGEAHCFSERLLKIPRDAMPQRPSASHVDVIPVIRDQPEVVRVAIPSVSMKINPRFLEALQAIRTRARVRMEFHFLMGAATGLFHMHADNVIQQYLPGAIVHSHQPYAQYLQGLAECDMYLNPFPFGNANGLVDTTCLGLVGVCKLGQEVFERIDAALFRRLSMPESLIAHSVPEYVASAIRLAEDHGMRNNLRRALLTRDAVKVLFAGRDEVFGEMLLAEARRTVTG